MAYAAPAFASGESASAVLTAPSSGSASTFTWTYAFDQSGGHKLSNMAIAFCSADILADVVSAGPSATIYTSGDVAGGHTDFGPGIKFGVTDPEGAFTVTFAHEHSVSAGAVKVQSHSGDGQEGDATTYADGPACPSEETPPPGGDRDENGDPTDIKDPAPTTNNPVMVITSDPAPTSSTPDPAPSTAVLGSTLERATVDPVVPAVAVLGDTVNPAAELPRTGSGDVQPLLALALSLIAGGSALRAVSSRRTRSASSPS